MSAEHDDTEFRDCWGMPHVDGPMTRPRAYVTGGSAPVNSSIHQTTDNRVNTALPWFSATAAGLGFGGLVVLCMLQPWETADRAVAAEIMAEFSQQIAKQNADIDVAKYEASIAKNAAQKAEIKLSDIKSR